jgi:hypothetical protein
MSTRSRALSAGQRVADAGHAGRHAGAHRFPIIELADEQQPGLAVLQDLRDGAGRERRVQRHRDVAGHPDREVAHEPPGAVLRQDRDARSGLEALLPEEGRHAARLVDHVLPAEFLEQVVAHRLGESDAVGRRAFPVIEALEGEGR